MFNLDKETQRAEAQEKGILFELVDPLTHQKTGATITAAGYSSRRARRARRDAMAYVTDQRQSSDTPRAKITEEEHQVIVNRTMAGCVMSWTGFYLDEAGTPLDCTFENVLRVFEQVPWVQDELDLALLRRVNFP